MSETTEGRRLTANDAHDLLDDPLAASLCLSLVKGVGPLVLQTLLETFGSPADVLRAAPSQLRQVPGVGAKLATTIADAVARNEVVAEIQRCRQHEIRILTQDDAGYPEALQNIYDPPHTLFCQGELLPQDALAVAIVGTRHATHYGKRQAHRLAGSLTRAGITIVSGLARGIDAEAHRAALEAGGRTLAVFAGGLLNVYPVDHRELAFDVAQSGALLSEFPCEWPISRGSFPRRNRLITGLSQGVIVIEAGERSGALTSARHAMEQGREVFALPGPVDSRVSRGCHALLRDGATLVETADDVLDALGPLATAAVSPTGEEIRHPAELQLNEQERTILHHIGTQPTSIDRIVDASNLPVPRVLATISALEMRRLVRRLSGDLVCRV